MNGFSTIILRVEAISHDGQSFTISFTISEGKEGRHKIPMLRFARTPEKTQKDMVVLFGIYFGV